MPMAYQVNWAHENPTGRTRFGLFKIITTHQALENFVDLGTLDLDTGARSRASVIPSSGCRTTQAATHAISSWRRVVRVLIRRTVSVIRRIVGDTWVLEEQGSARQVLRYCGNVASGRK
jgi:hypothetical protein